MPTPYASLQTSYPEPSPRPRRTARTNRANLPSRRRKPVPTSTPTSTGKGAILELSARFLVNGVLACAAVASLVRLVPYAQTQKASLQEAQAAVAVAEQKNARLKADFSRYFDPRQASSVMQEQSGWKLPTQRQIVWIHPPQTQP